jgi:hypothetical protein
MLSIPVLLQDATHKAYCLSNLILRNREAPLPLLDAMRVRQQLLPLLLHVLGPYGVVNQ